jgi:hypothetical protein
MALRAQRPAPLTIAEIGRRFDSEYARRLADEGKWPRARATPSRPSAAAPAHFRRRRTTLRARGVFSFLDKGLRLGVVAPWAVAAVLHCVELELGGGRVVRGDNG